MVAKNMPFDMAFKIKAPAGPRNAANDWSGVIRDGENHVKSRHVARRSADK